uniref:Eukaryotic translation initiation factor 4 gamma 3 n=1 Tax=Ciona savignyi TaxID=51511 RepID=H2ZK86_CIOSA
GGYQSHPGPMPAPKVIKKVSIQREVDPLVRSENAWKPSKLDVKPNDVTEEELQTAEILRNVRSILNKLTPQKFNPLMKRLQSLEINTEQRLREVIDLIFEKAIDEPSFCEPYANMCRTMSQFRAPTPPRATFEFRKILLTRCQREFEKDRTNEEVLEELKTKIENASTPEEKATLTDDLEMCISKQRRRMLGNIRLIGELFKLQMLTESIMHNCIMSLFRARDDDSLESLCRLLTTIGKDLDHTKGKTRMDQYFEQINKIVREQKTSSRVRFMLKDVIDLRLNNWVQRAIKEKGPKTIDQIHADAKEEKEQFALKAAAIASNPPMKNQVNDGWTKVGVATQKPTRYDPNKMKLSKAQFDEANVTLGPSRGKSGWKSGSGSAATKSGSYSSTRDTEPAPRSSTPTMINRFSALGNQPQESTSPFQQRRARTKSGSRGSMGPPAAPYRGKDERQALLDAARKLTSQEEKKRGTSPSVKSSPRSESPITPAPQMDVAFLEKKSKSIIMEYLHLHDIKEAIECYAELKPPHNLFHIVVSSAMETSIEKSSTDREHVATLICELFKVGKLSEEQYLKGAATNIELAADLELDLPKVWSCMAELVAPVAPSILPHLVTLSQPLVELDKSLVFVMEILKKLISIMPADAVAKQWEEQHLQWNNFAPTTDPARIAELLNRNNLTMFGGAPNGRHSAINQTSNEDLATCVSNITRHLDKLQTDDMLFDWIEATFSAKERSEAKFIRALTTAICQRAIVETGGAMEVDKQVIISRSVVFKKFVDNEEKELEAVYALQKLYSDLEQPPNILKLLFDLIYDEEIISEQTFFKWEKTDNPAESEGRGVALMSVKPFFTWLREAEVESDE